MRWIHAVIPVDDHRIRELVRPGPGPLYTAMTFLFDNVMRVSHNETRIKAIDSLQDMGAGIMKASVLAKSGSSYTQVGRKFASIDAACRATTLTAHRRPWRRLWCAARRHVKLLYRLAYQTGQQQSGPSAPRAPASRLALRAPELLAFRVRLTQGVFI